MEKRTPEVIDLRGPHPLEEYFIEKYPYSTELQSVHLAMAYGLVARECRIAYNSNFSPVSPLSQEDSQEEYARLTSLVHSVHAIRQGRLSDLFLRETRWGKFYDTLRGFYPELDDQAFNTRCNGIRKSQKTYLLEGKKGLGKSELKNLKDYAKKVRTASELIVADALHADDPEQLKRNIQELEPKLWRHFSDEFYWKSELPFEALAGDERMDARSRYTFAIRGLFTKM